MEFHVYWKVKNKPAHFHAYLGPPLGISRSFRPETIFSVSRFTPMTFLSGYFPPNCFTFEFLTFEARQNHRPWSYLPLNVPIYIENFNWDSLENYGSEVIIFSANVLTLLF